MSVDFVDKNFIQNLTVFFYKELFLKKYFQENGTYICLLFRQSVCQTKSFKIYNTV